MSSALSHGVTVTPETDARDAHLDAHRRGSLSITVVVCPLPASVLARTTADVVLLDPPFELMNEITAMPVDNLDAIAKTSGIATNIAIWLTSYVAIQLTIHSERHRSTPAFPFRISAL